jgi:hypothetical protein
MFYHWQKFTILLGELVFLVIIVKTEIRNGKSWICLNQHIMLKLKISLSLSLSLSNTHSPSLSRSIDRFAVESHYNFLSSQTKHNCSSNTQDQRLDWLGMKMVYLHKCSDVPFCSFLWPNTNIPNKRVGLVQIIIPSKSNLVSPWSDKKNCSLGVNQQSVSRYAIYSPFMQAIVFTAMGINWFILLICTSYV